jgi:hypothetical protein
LSDRCQPIESFLTRTAPLQQSGLVGRPLFRVFWGRGLGRGTTNTEPRWAARLSLLTHFLSDMLVYNSWVPTCSVERRFCEKLRKLPLDNSIRVCGLGNRDLQDDWAYRRSRAGHNKQAYHAWSNRPSRTLSHSSRPDGTCNHESRVGCGVKVDFPWKGSKLLTGHAYSWQPAYTAAMLSELAVPSTTPFRMQSTRWEP